jgi:hypothetical protein
MSNSGLETTIQEVIREINLSSLEDYAKLRLLDRLRAVQASDGDTGSGGAAGSGGSAAGSGGSAAGSGGSAAGSGGSAAGSGGSAAGSGGSAPSPPAGGSEYGLFRMVVIFLGTIAVVTVAGALFLSAIGKPAVPDGVIAIGSAAVGALAGLLTPSPKAG